MPRIRKLTPRYLEHKRSGRGRAVWTDSAGRRQERLLPGAHESAESQQAFGRLLLEVETTPHAALAERKDVALVEILGAYHDHSERHYRGPDGKPTSEFREVKLVIRALRELYGDTPAAGFGPLAMKAVRQGWIANKLSRSECNRRTNLIRRVFKWAASEELVPASVCHGLSVVSGLQRGRTAARETDPIVPVDDAVVDGTIPHLNRHVAGLVMFQRLTGCRPGEACAVRRSDIDTGGAVWLYKPTTHKTAHRGMTRTIAVGPKAQAVLKEFFTPDLAAYLFSPQRAMEEHHAERAANRATPRYPSHMKRNATKRKARPGRAPKEKYNATSYARAITRAIEGVSNGIELAPIPHWHPNQLRHTYATKARKLFSLEHAGAALGHSKMSATEIYAERDAGLAVEVATRIG